MDFANLKKLTQLDGVAGRETVVREEITRQLSALTSAIHTDALGNLVALVPGNSQKTVLLCAHMDEVGLMINYISPEGFLYFVPVGGIDPRTLLAQRVQVHTSKGVLTGVIGTKPAHITREAERSQAVPMNDLCIDVGLSGAEAAAAVQVGDYATLQRAYEEFGQGRICTKALDDRVGCFCILEALKQIKKPAYNVCAVFSAQEEVGARGAGVAAFGIKADLALAVDATGAADIPLCRPQDYLVRLGAGAAITALDATSITSKELFEDLLSLCRENKIRHQVRIAPRGGNDAGVLQRSREGQRACALSVPVRNIHSNVEVADKQDIAAMIDLLGVILAGKLKLN